MGHTRMGLPLPLSTAPGKAQCQPWAPASCLKLLRGKKEDRALNKSVLPQWPLGPCSLSSLRAGLVGEMGKEAQLPTQAHQKRQLGLGREHALSPCLSQQRMETARDAQQSNSKDFVVQLRVCSLACRLAPGHGCVPGLSSQRRLRSPGLAADELPDELLQLVLIVPACKCRGQVEPGACGTGRLLQHLGSRNGLSTLAVGLRTQGPGPHPRTLQSGSLGLCLCADAAPSQTTLSTPPGSRRSQWFGRPRGTGNPSHLQPPVPASVLGRHQVNPCISMRHHQGQPGRGGEHTWVSLGNLLWG